MNNIATYISEKLHLGKSSTVKNTFTDEELFKDYDKITSAYTKAEKQSIADKYGVTVLKIRNIQLAILEQLRLNRQTKKEFNNNDFTAFIRQEVPNNIYKRLVPYLDNEPREFVEYLLKHFESNLTPSIKKFRHQPKALSMAERNILRWCDFIQKYLDEH